MRTSIYMLFVWIMVVGVAGSVAGQTSTPQMMSFEEAYQMMEQNNPGLLRMKEQVKQKEFEQKAKRGLHLPTVSLNAEAVTMSDPLHLDLTPVRDAIVPLYNTLGTYGVFSGVPNPDPATNQVLPVLPDNMSTAAVRDKLLEAGQEVQAGDWDRMIQEKNFASVSAGFVWPIYVGSKIQGANEAAGVNLGISKEEVRVEQGALLTELVQRYYGLELGLQVVKVREQMLESMDKHYQDAQKMFDNGIIAKVELLHAQVARNEADREYKQAVRNLDIIRSGLAATLANDSLENLTPSSHLFINKELEGLSGWISKAKQENPMLKQIQGKKELVNIQHKVEKRNYLPSVAAMGNYNLIDKNLSPYMPDWLVGVGMKWTLFEGMSRNNKIHASETLHNQVEFAEQKAHSDLEAYLTKLYQELHMQMEQKTELETTLELASEYAASTEKAFNEGFATSTSVVEAYTKVAQVKALRLKVLYDYDVALARFLQATGTPEDFTSYCRGENSVLESL
ncbi:TolC family protein [Maribellus sp. YY47]|uniref:TolC family protein n=1 Tax=Maribellus sp. YY47 TaxID=2929486 RepID=UPI002001BD1B|nr:TolC family protein [Maribellus sp. YY47]MCK3683916.1 TolC family protein [Maribellus sp. YY47]